MRVTNIKSLNPSLSLDGPEVSESIASMCIMFCACTCGPVPAISLLDFPRSSRLQEFKK